MYDGYSYVEDDEDDPQENHREPIPAPLMFTVRAALAEKLWVQPNSVLVRDHEDDGQLLRGEWALVYEYDSEVLWAAASEVNEMIRDAGIWMEPRNAAVLVLRRV